MKSKRSLATELYETSQILTAGQTQEYLHAIHAGHQAKEQLEQTQERPEDAEALRRTVRNGERCRQQLAVAYLPLLTRICKRYWYRSYTLPIDDLIQEGTIGMLEAIDNYDGAPLNFAAAITIKVKDALCHIIKQSRVVRYPPNVASALRKIRYVSECLTKWLGHWPQPEEIAEEMVIPSAITHTLLSYTQFSVSLDKPIGEGEDSVMGDIVAAKIPTPEEVIEQNDLRERMLELLETLEPIEESVLKIRFGFMDEPLSPAETAEELSILLDEEQRVEVKALRKMRHPSRSQYLKDFLYE